MKKGFLITLEGIDGCGKSTLAASLNKILIDEGHDVLLTKEPGGTKFGMGLRSILAEQKEKLTPKTEFLLFASDRAAHIEYIRPYLERGFIVISDRMADSSLAYQGFGRGLDLGMIDAINKWAMGGIAPDLTFYLRVDLETALHRIAARRETLSAFEKEEKSFLLNVIDGYEKIFSSRSNVIILDGKKSANEVLKSAMVDLEKFWGKE